MFLLVAFAIISIGFSFLCSILEASLLSVTPSYIASLRQERPALFARLRRLKDEIDDPLSAILTLNTIAHTAGATGVGAQVAVVFGEAWLGLASGLMTLAILVFSEIIPKTIGAKYWRAIAPSLPAILGTLMKLLLPFVWLSKQITQRIAQNEDDTDIRGEISALAEIGRDQQALDEEERRMIQNVLRFHEIKVSQVMTPRTVCKYITPRTTVAEFREKVSRGPFSRYPVIDEEGEAQGYVHRADLLNMQDDSQLQDHLRPIKRVKGATNIELVFSQMLQERQHIAVVYDELGTWLGVVTLEDILETLLGTEIMDETDNVSNLRRYARQRWSRRLRRTRRQPD
ncbi:CNNM domain-containing protein [Marinobacter oulmenensis]|uniref:CBS domain containing-hemolysin-like protein n=1 Tax=Marinobacter oulmenensis TaxID=643747 RepID=A0A840UFU9_9GAMM|nr:CNNM domain-containing protein [Marinobacter oulmenensis]MBB5319677.1 CBS domain containing-hemolysin-like protein [Marinobacter oulmenensis]